MCNTISKKAGVVKIMESKKIHGISLSNYRGIGRKQKIGPFSRLNIFIGKNNSGKSCLLSFIEKYYSQILKEANRIPPKNLSIDNLDLHLGTQLHQFNFGIGVHPKDININLYNKYEEHKTIANIKNIIQTLSDEEILWLSINGNEINFEKKDIFSANKNIKPYEWQATWSALTGKEGGNFENFWLPETLKILATFFKISTPEVHIIPAIREVRNNGNQIFDFSGNGIIDKLAEYQNPAFYEQSKKEVFEKINNFLRVVTDTPDAKIEIPHDRKHILVEMNGKILPLSSLGTGIHEVVMMAAFCTLADHCVMCIEEPEIHLHPLLQRKFINYLIENTNNQYFIATHSSSFIDRPDANIFHVYNENGETKVTHTPTSHQKHLICKDLGYKPSDLFQTNCIIWVEGPSDRIYLNHWINMANPTLKEGIDYSIMFYGGRLLNHLSAEDHDVTNFISLTSINRNSAIVIDSDKRNSQSKINDTKKRIEREFKSNNATVWITAGREIENYIDKQTLSAALEATYPNEFSALFSCEKYESALPFKTKSRKTRENIDKIKVAKAVCKLEIEGSHQCEYQLDLKKKIQELVEFIEKSNQ